MSSLQKPFIVARALAAFVDLVRNPDHLERVFQISDSLASWLIVVQLMHLPFTWLPWPALAAALGAVVVTVTLGLAGTYTALGQKPAPVLRNL